MMSDIELKARLALESAILFPLERALDDLESLNPSPYGKDPDAMKMLEDRRRDLCRQWREAVNRQKYGISIIEEILN